MKTQHRDQVVRFNPSAATVQEIDLQAESTRFYVYLLARDKDGPISVSLTQDIAKRVGEQKNDLHARDFTSTNGTHTLVHVEEFDDLYEAMCRYSHLRPMDRTALSLLIDEDNPDWRDLYGDYTG